MIDVCRAETMRREGATYQQIADYFGITKQGVHSAMKNHGVIRRRYEAIFESCPYKGLRRYLLENKRVKFTEVCFAVFGNCEEKTRAKTRRMIEGDNVLLTVNNIKRLEKFTGLGFDELFCAEVET